MPHATRTWLAILTLTILLAPQTRADNPLTLHARSRAETSPGSGRYHATTKAVEWNPKQTAMIVCDMWDLHHCLNATRRGAEMAPRMNKVLDTARKQGILIIHAPSSCMKTYADHPARKRAQAAPAAKNLPKDISKWCRHIPAEDKLTYPIDQTDGGEDDDPEEHKKWAAKLKAMGRNPRAPWKSQTDLLTIRNEDVISDSGVEIWNIMEQRGIKNVILVGVHTNMCVLGRPFGLRQMAKNGKNVVLMRDMTDTMYNPKRKPYVSHFTGTDLIVKYIEKCVCPTITSVDFLGGKEFVFKNDKRPHLVVVVAETEYQTWKTLPAFAKKHLDKDYKVSFVFANAKDRNDIPGIKVLNKADLALFSIRRRVLPKEQMEVIRKFIAAGKPLVAIRTSSHAFALRKQKPPTGYHAWPEFDHDVIGGNYHNHHGKGPKVTVVRTPSAGKHPILAGVEVKKLVGNGSLYRTRPLAKTATPLLIGAVAGKEPEPVAWINKRKDGGKVFYTSLAHWDNFKDPIYERFFLNGIHWAAGRK